MEASWLSSASESVPEARDKLKSGSLEVITPSRFSGNLNVSRSGAETTTPESFHRQHVLFCDFCLDDELLASSLAKIKLGSDEIANIENPILSSEVTISIDTDPGLEASGIRVLLQDNTQHHQTDSLIQSSSSAEITIPTHRRPVQLYHFGDLPTSDADDERSLYSTCSRTFNNTHTKGVRAVRGRTLSRKSYRRGLDLNRENLKRLEDQHYSPPGSMDHFRKVFRHLVSSSSSQTAEAAFVEQLTASKSSSTHQKLKNVKNLARSVVGSLSRSRGRKMREQDTGGVIATVNVRAQHQQGSASRLSTIRAVSTASMQPVEKISQPPSPPNADNVQDTTNVEITGKKQDNEDEKENSTIFEQDHSSTDNSTWEEHLRRDLYQRHSMRRHISLHATVSDQIVQHKGPDVYQRPNHLDYSTLHNQQPIYLMQNKDPLTPSPSPKRKMQYIIAATPQSVRSLAVTEIEDSPQEPGVRRLTSSSSSTYSRLASSTAAPSFPIPGTSLAPSVSCPLLPMSGERLGDIKTSTGSDPFVDSDTSGLWGGSRQASSFMTTSYSYGSMGRRSLLGDEPYPARDHGLSIHPLTTELVPGLKPYVGSLRRAIEAAL